MKKAEKMMDMCMETGLFNGMEYETHLLALLDGAWMIRHEAGVVVHLLLHDPPLLLDPLHWLAGDAESS